MNGYKKIIKSQALRLKILRCLDFVPDYIMVKIQYFIKTGRRLNLKDPKRYTEKLQWMKVYYRSDEMRECVDKYSVRDFVKKRGLENILNESYGVYESPEKIDWNSLPDSFVLKDTMGGGGLDVVLVRDKKTVDREKLMQRMQKWVDSPTNCKNSGREWMYENRKHRIIAEKLLDCSNGDLPDYKFFCFNGEPECVYFMRNYRNDHQQGELAFLDMDFKLLNVCRTDFKPITKQPDKPQNFEKMIEIVRILSKGFPHVRVDLFNVDGNIIFGEMTFFNASGYSVFEPDSYDYELGKKFILPDISRGGGAKVIEQQQ